MQRKIHFVTATLAILMTIVVGNVYGNTLDQIYHINFMGLYIDENNESGDLVLNPQEDFNFYAKEGALAEIHGQIFQIENHDPYPNKTPDMTAPDRYDWYMIINDSKWKIWYNCSDGISPNGVAMSGVLHHPFDPKNWDPNQRYTIDNYAYEFGADFKIDLSKQCDWSGGNEYFPLEYPGFKMVVDLGLVGDNNWQGTFYLVPAPCPTENDTDGDCFPDNIDNCPLVNNIEQIDSDKDGIGDVCDDQNKIITIEPTGPCQEWMGPECVGTYHWTQMVDSNLNFNTEFIDLLEVWDHSSPNTLPNEWTVTREVNVIDAGYWPEVDGRFDIKRVLQGEGFCRISFNLKTGEYIKYPIVWVSRGSDWEELNVSYQPNTVIPVMTSETQGDAKQITPDRISSVYWVNKGETGILENFTSSHLRGLNYDMNLRKWIFSGFDRSWGYDVTYKFSWGIYPDMNRQEVILTYDGGSYTFNFDVTDIKPLPTVPAEETIEQDVISKSGKAIKGLTGIETTVQNIRTREIVDPYDPEGRKGLVVQWAEPDGALFGGIELKMWIGNNPMNQQNGAEDEALWIDCPAQIGSVVIPADEWAGLKERLNGKGLSEAKIIIMYRTTSFNGKWSFHNRGYSEPIFVPIQ